MEKVFKVGYAKVNVTPPMGIDVTGYYKVRKADGVLDELNAVAIALNLGEKTVAIVAIDCLGTPKDFADICRENASKKTGLPFDAIFIHSTHSHRP